MVGSTARSKSRLQVSTTALSTEIASPVSYRIGIQTGTRYRDLNLHNELRSIMILRAHWQIFFATNMTPPSPLIRACATGGYVLETVYGDLITYITDKVEEKKKYIIMKSRDLGI